MTRKEFAYTLAGEVRSLIVDDCRVEVTECPKDNGVILYGIMVFREGEHMIPSIHCEPLFEEFEEGESLTKLAAKLLSLRAELPVPAPFEGADVFDFSQMRSRIRFRLISREKNARMLKEWIHRDYLDLAKTYFVRCDVGMDRNAFFTVDRKLFAIWGITEDELDAAATENVRQFDSLCIRDIMTCMEDTLYGHFSGDHAPDYETDPEGTLYVVSNRLNHFGSAALFFPELFEEPARRLDSDLFLLPCSVHELLLLPTGGLPAGDLKRMVSDVNLRELTPSMVLSERVYRYDRRTRRIVIEE